MLDELERADTRSGGRRTIGTVDIVRSGHAATRSGDMMPDHPLLYVVNFTNEKGFAVLGADSRLAPVIAVTASGSIDPAHFTPSSTRSGETATDYTTAAEGAAFVSSLVMDYAMSMAGPDREDDGQPVKPKNGNYDNETVGDDTGGGRGGPNWTTEWETTVRIDPLLVTKWGQWMPFNRAVNNFCNAVTGPFGGGDKHYPVGCVAIAAAQIAVYYRHPASYDDYVFDWNNIPGEC